jgi:hypothetical protein
MKIYRTIQDLLSRRRTAYVKAFLNPYGQEVLEDLARFCRANESTFHPDPRAHAVAEGRREVWLRIQKHLQLTDEQLWALYGTPSTQPSRNEQ